MKRLSLLLLAILLVDSHVAHAQSAVTVDDFESYTSGGLPTAWKFVSKDKDIYPVQKTMDSYEKVIVHDEDGNQFARATTKHEALRISLIEGKQFSWDLAKHPRLRWRWRANHLPKGASEKGDNDVGGAIYVTFDKKSYAGMGAPYSIKYTYSSTLPVGTTISFGSLKAIVVSSGKNGTGSWKTVTRNVVKDYRRVFGEKPPQPVSITMWSDSDTTKDRAEVDFDDIQLLPPH